MGRRQGDSNYVYVDDYDFSNEKEFRSALIDVLNRISSNIWHLTKVIEDEKETIRKDTTKE